MSLMRCLKNKFLVFLVLFFLLADNSAAEIFLIEMQGTINPVIADFVEKEFKALSGEDTDGVIIKLDTPGGLMESTRKIVKTILGAPFPVIVYVGDAGARASSAGLFITMAADVAVMAEGTNIGAAHPVQMGSGDSEVLEGKIVEDARAYIQALAQRQGRNTEWVSKAVTESASITSGEALEKNVIEYTVKDYGHLKEVLEGKEIEKAGQVFVLSFIEEPKRLEMPFFRKFLNYIANPNFAYIFFTLGILGIIYEFASPGIELGAVLGGIFLVLAALSFQIIPVNTAGILLIVLGVILMVLDMWVPSFGILTVGGIISFVMGSLTLFDVEEFTPGIAPGVVAGAALAFILFFLFAAGSVLRIQGKKVSTGEKGMIGTHGTARTSINPSGKVFVRGEIWDADSESDNIEKDENVVVAGISGNRLKVRKANQEKGE